MTIGLFFDTETNGLPNWKKPSGGKEQPHITQLAAVLVDLESGREHASMNLLVQPDGWTVPQECVELNGLDANYLSFFGIDEQVVAEALLDMNMKADVRLAFNTTFDNRIIRIATKRFFSESEQTYWHEESEYQCVMQMARKAMDVKSVNLEDAYKYYTGNILADAHDAMSDTRAMMEVYYAIKAAEHVPLDPEYGVQPPAATPGNLDDF